MNYELTLTFDTDAPEFSRGVEVGMIYEHLRISPNGLQSPMRIANAEMAARLAEAARRSLRIEEHDETWMTVHFGERGSA